MSERRRAVQLAPVVHVAAALLVAVAFITASTEAFAQAAAAQAPARAPDVIFVPTPEDVVDKMLEMAKVQAGDIVYDLGCGDGRIVIAAAKKHGATGVGIDIDPQRIKEAKENALKAGVTAKVKFMEADLFTTDISQATVVTLYLLPTLNVKLMPKLMAELRPGTRIVSHAFDMGDSWPPEQKADVGGRMVYYWTIPAKKK
jgi:SAM-dependent methyltransferase